MGTRDQDYVTFLEIISIAAGESNSNTSRVKYESLKASDFDVSSALAFGAVLQELARDDRSATTGPMASLIVSEFQSSQQIHLADFPQTLEQAQLYVKKFLIPELDSGTDVAWLNLWNYRPRTLGERPGLHPRSKTLRRSQGAFYTPRGLVEKVLSITWLTLLSEPGSRQLALLDPTCGSGNFLVAAQQLASVRQERETLIYGVDTDPLAVSLARARLALGHPSPPTDIVQLLGSRIVVANALELFSPHSVDKGPLPAHFDCVVGNPPFINRLKGQAPIGPQERVFLSDVTGDTARTYTDLSAIFLHLASELTSPGGYVALCQPSSVVSARDTGAIRDHLNERAHLVELLTSNTGGFEASVGVCVPILQVRSAPLAVTGPIEHAGSATHLEEPRYTWASHLAKSLGIPAPGTRRARSQEVVIGDLARVTADFRDQYYWVCSAVEEAPTPWCHLLPIITTGLIGSSLCKWGNRPARIAGQTFNRPGLDATSDTVTNEPRFEEWLRTRMVPKILVATQSKILESTVDEEGIYVPMVPVVSIIPHSTEDLFLIQAALQSPFLSGLATYRHIGTGMSPGALKLSAKQIAALPLPGHSLKWEEAGLLHRDLRHASYLERPEEIYRVVAEAAKLSDLAYGTPSPELFTWWSRRLDIPGLTR